MKAPRRLFEPPEATREKKNRAISVKLRKAYAEGRHKLSTPPDNRRKVVAVNMKTKAFAVFPSIVDCARWLAGVSGGKLHASEVRIKDRLNGKYKRPTKEDFFFWYEEANDWVNFAKGG